MSVSSRHTYIGAVAAIAMIAAGGVAVAGGGPDGARSGGHAGFQGAQSKTSRPNYQSSNRTPVVRPSFQPQVNAPKVRPNFTPNIIIPRVNVAGSNVIVNQGSVAVNQSTIVLGGPTSFVTTGGFFTNGGFATPATPVAPSALGGLDVEGADQTITETVTKQVPVTEETCAPQIQQASALRPVQAVCIDDKGSPHPASRISADEQVDASFNGEIFRCLAGAHMQVTLGQLENGTPSFAQGETFSCRKGEALVHGAGGKLTCAPQAPQRNCNERSLLRRHGPGLKLVHTTVKQETCVPQQRTTYKTVTNQVQRTVPNQNGPIVLDGGVGQGVF